MYIILLQYLHTLHNSSSVVHSPEMSDVCWVEVRSEKNGFVAEKARKYRQLDALK